MALPEIAILGAGNVGREVAFWTALKELGDIVWWNRTPETAIGNALDLAQAGPVAGFEVSVRGTGDISEIKRSRVVVITAGVPRKPGQAREELVASNAAVVKSLSEQVRKHSPHSVVIVVTNPVDAMAYLALKATRFPKQRVLGMAGILDSSRFRYFISQELGLSHRKVSAMVLGSHGEDMVPVLSRAKADGRPLHKILDEKKLKGLVEKTRGAGAEIVKLLNANASFSVGASVALMLEAIVKGKKSVQPCSAYLEGEYGLRDVCIGVPVRLGKRGAEKIIEAKLWPEEMQALHKAAERMRELNAIAMKA